MPLCGMLTISPSTEEWGKLLDYWIKYPWSTHFDEYIFVIEHENHIHIAFRANGSMPNNSDAFRRRLINENMHMPKIKYMRQYRLSYSTDKNPYIGAIGYVLKYNYIETLPEWDPTMKGKYKFRLIYPDLPTIFGQYNSDEIMKKSIEFAKAELNALKTHSEILTLPEYGAKCIGHPNFLTWDIRLNNDITTSQHIYNEMAETGYICLANTKTLTQYLYQLQVQHQHLKHKNDPDLALDL